MKKETQYRTFQELIDSVSIDLKGIDWENMIEPIELIKVAERLNTQLGIKIAPSIDRCIQIEKGRAKLPSGFHSMNTAWLLQDVLEKRGIDAIQKTYVDTLVENLQTAQDLVNAVYSGIRKTQFQTVITSLAKGVNVVKHTLNTDDILVQALSENDEILLFSFSAPNNCDIIINNESNRDFNNVKITVATGKSFSDVDNLNTVVSENTVTVTSRHQAVVYGNPEQIELVNPRFHQAPQLVMGVTNRRVGYIKNGWIAIPSVRSGLLRLNYKSLMENENGDYIVLDHPLVNDYYEYSIKERIFENLVLAGHVEYSQRMQMMAMKAEQNKLTANGYTSTPDFAEMKRAHTFNRARAYHKFYRNN